MSEWEKVVEIGCKANDHEFERIADELEAGGFVSPADQIKRATEATIRAVIAAGYAIVPRKCPVEFRDTVGHIDSPRLWAAILAGVEVKPDA